MPITPIDDFIREAKDGPFAFSSVIAEFPVQVDSDAWVNAVLDVIDLDDIAPGYGDVEVEDDPHITILFGLTDADPEPVRELVRGSGELVGTLGRTMIFQPPDREYDVVVLSIDSESIRALNSLIAEAFDNEHSFEYTPHMTLANVARGQGAQYDNIILEGFTGMELKTNVVLHSNKGGDKTPLFLG